MEMDQVNQINVQKCLWARLSFLKSHKRFVYNWTVKYGLDSPTPTPQKYIEVTFFKMLSFFLSVKLFIWVSDWMGKYFRYLSSV